MATADDPVWREGRLRNENEAAPAMSLAAQAALRGVIGNDIGPPSPEEVALQNYVNANVNSKGEPSPQVLAQFKTAQGGNPPLGEVSGMPAGQPMPPAPGQMMPPAPQPGGGAQIQKSPEIAQLEQRRNEAWKQGIDRSEPYRQARESAFGQVQGLANELEATSAFRPRLEGLPTYHAAPVDPQQFTNFGAAATVFASLASLLTRQPLTAALNAAGQAMQGYSEGRFAQVDQDLKVFRTQFDSAMARNRQMLDEYNSILNDKKLNFATRYEVLKAAAAGEGDEITRSFLQAGKYEDAIRTIDARDRASNALQQQYQKLNAMLEAAQIRAGGQGANALLTELIPPELMDKHGEEFLAALPPDLANSIRAIASGRASLNTLSIRGGQREQMLRMVSQFDPNFDATKFSGNQSYSQTVGRRGAILGMAGQEAYAFADAADASAAKVERTQFVPVNEMIMRVARGAGSPEERDLAVRVNSLVNAYARAINPTGQIHVSDKEHARELLNPADSPEAFRAATNALRNELEIADRVQRRIREQGAAQAGGQAIGSPAAPRSFASEAEAEAALSAGQIKSGDSITIGGRKARVP